MGNYLIVDYIQFSIFIHKSDNIIMVVYQCEIRVLEFGICLIDVKENSKY